MEQRQISDLSERLEIYFTQLKKQVEALERDNHEIRQLLIKHVVTMSPMGPLSWSADNYRQTGSYHHF